MASLPLAIASTYLKIQQARDPEPLPLGYDPLNDAAIRASLESQGLAIPTGDISGSNVPQIQIGGGTPALAGLPGRGAKIEDAARQEFRASQTAIGARLAASLRASDIDAAQRGTLRSGGQQGRRDDLRIAAIQASAQAGQGIALDRLGLEQRAKEAQDRFDLTVAQLNAQRAQATNQLYLAFAKAAIAHGPDLLSTLGVGGGNDLGIGDQSLPTDFFDDFGIDDSLPVDFFDVGGTV